MYKHFRFLFGIYLAFHFFELIPHADTLFGTSMPFNPELSPTYNVFPNAINYGLPPSYLLRSLCLLAGLYSAGLYSNICAFFLWYGWACLLNRNVFIANPGMPYVGWLLLASTLIPNSGRIPRRIYWLAWFLMGLGYTASGLHKLQCPSWLNGTALYHVLTSPLARDNFIVDFLLSAPPIFLKLGTWFSLALEIMFLPLGMFYELRPWFWLTYIGFHLGIILTVNFVDLTLGVLMIHFFTFDPTWFNL